jgi:LysR family hydrogen peroxide-inducible transcriptional activator
VQAAELFVDRFLLALPPEPLAPELQPVARPEQIPAESLLLLDEGHCLGDQALNACGVGREGRRRRFGAASLVTLAHMVASGQGVTLLPEIAAATEGRGMRLSRFAAPEPRRTIGLARVGHGDSPSWFGGFADCVRAAAARIPRPDLPAA